MRLENGGLLGCRLSADRGCFDLFDPLPLARTYSRIVIHKANEPDAAIDFFDSNGLTSQVLRLIFLRSR
jgi:hypothetical protein